MRKTFRLIIFLLAVLFLLNSAAFATDGMKTLKVLYQNIKVKVNNEYKTPPQEPFLINGTTYIPLRFVTEALGADVDWDGTTNTVSINLETVDQHDLDLLRLEILQKENEILFLKAQINQMWDYDFDFEEDDQIRDLESTLNKRYDELEDVNIDRIELDGDEDELDVRIETELYRGNYDAWEDLRDIDIEDWLDDLVDDIQDELDRDTEITGVIYDTEDREVLVEFEKDGRRSLDIDFEDEDYRDKEEDVEDVARELKGEIWNIHGYDFKIVYIDYDERRDEVEVQLIDYSGDLLDKSDWRDLSSRYIEWDIEDLCLYIADEFEDEADVEPWQIVIEVYDENWDLLDDFEYDVDDEEFD